MDIKTFISTIRRGTISVEELGRGMHKAYKNAEALKNDAKVLLPQSPGRSISLAVLAFEELAKVVLFAEGAVQAAGGPVDWDRLQRHLNLRSHQHKQRILANYGRRLAEPVTYEQDLPAELSPLLDTFKQYGFYVDVGMGQFYSPQEFGEENREWAEWLIAVAEERLDSFAELHSTEENSMAVAKRAARFVEAVVRSEDENELRRRLGELDT